MKTQLLVACLVVAGCARGGKTVPEDVVSTTTITSAPMANVPAESDHRLTRRVEATIASDRSLSAAARNVVLTATDGVVTLTGTVNDARAKAAIEQEIAAVTGVDETLNKVHVAPTRDVARDESDETIAYSLQRSLLFDPAVAHDSERVSIEVVKGKVILRGTTSDLATTRAVERIAAFTPGVLATNNKLRVGPPSTERE